MVGLKHNNTRVNRDKKKYSYTHFLFFITHFLFRHFHFSLHHFPSTFPLSPSTFMLPSILPFLLPYFSFSSPYPFLLPYHCFHSALTSTIFLFFHSFSRSSYILPITNPPLPPSPSTQPSTSLVTLYLFYPLTPLTCPHPFPHHLHLALINAVSTQVIITQVHREFQKSSTWKK